MKKILLITVVIIVVPFIIVSIFIKEKKEVKYNLITKTAVRIKRDKKNVIEVLPFEEYIVGVVAGEMPVNFENEALKALAVAARNYAYKKMQANKEKEYDLIDTTANQVYLDLETLKNKWNSDYIKNINKIRKSVYETIDEYVYYNDEIIDVFYFSTSNGKTENASYVFKTDKPYLVSVESPWDEKESSAFKSKKVFEYNDFCDKMGIICSKPLIIKDILKSESNRIVSLNINGVNINAREMYVTLGLRSTDFEIEQKKDKLIFYMKGFGHGVGLSQYGANGMAKEGKTYKEILTHYYKGTEVKKR